MFSVDTSQGVKYGACVCADCFARGPEVRRDYDFSDYAPWRKEVEQKWNNRHE
jgi:hypothetical protein